MGLSRLLPRSAQQRLPAQPGLDQSESESESESGPDAAPPRLQALPEPDGTSAPAAQEQVMAKIIAFANQKGGVAKTTTTINLGVAIRELGYRVLVVDLDPQGNLTMSQGMNPDT